MKLHELLNLKFPELENKKIKIVRHADNKYVDFKKIKKEKEKLLQYQREQSKPVFEGCDYIISFMGLESTSSLLIGIFKVNGVKTNIDNHNYIYDLEEINIPELKNDFYERLIIDWGKATTAWHQWYNQEKEVLEILPAGFIGEFPGYTELTIDFFTLKKLYENPQANKVWVNKLKSVSGIYIILDNSNGDQYIGSAYGKNEGIWGRWQSYAQNGHGGNKMLVEILQKDPNYCSNFTYAILQPLPSNLIDKEVIAYENIYKEKLGTRAFGLNKN